MGLAPPAVGVVNFVDVLSGGTFAWQDLFLNLGGQVAKSLLTVWGVLYDRERLHLPPLIGLDEAFGIGIETRAAGSGTEWRAAPAGAGTGGPSWASPWEAATYCSPGRTLVGRFPGAAVVTGPTPTFGGPDPTVTGTTFQGPYSALGSFLRYLPEYQPYTASRTALLGFVADLGPTPAGCSLRLPPTFLGTVTTPRRFVRNVSGDTSTAAWEVAGRGLFCAAAVDGAVTAYYAFGSRPLNAIAAAQPDAFFTYGDASYSHVHGLLEVVVPAAGPASLTAAVRVRQNRVFVYNTMNYADTDFLLATAAPVVPACGSGGLGLRGTTVPLVLPNPGDSPWAPASMGQLVIA